MYDNVASQIPIALSDIEAQLCDMEAKGLMRSDNVTAKEAFNLVASFDNLQSAVDGALYVQVRNLVLPFYAISFHFAQTNLLQDSIQCPYFKREVYYLWLVKRNYFSVLTLIAVTFRIIIVY